MLGLSGIAGTAYAAENEAVHYYSASSSETGAGSNYDNDGAKAKDSIVIGISSTSEGINSTVIGNHNTLKGNTNDENNSIVVGHNTEVEGIHNAVFGTDYHNSDTRVTKVFGDQNTVIGVGNLVGYTAEKDKSDPTKWIYTKKGSKSDQNVAVGLNNTVNGGSVVVGTSSNVGALGTSLGHANTVNATQYLQYGLALGDKNTVSGSESMAVGKDNSVTGDWSIAIGYKNTTTGDYTLAVGKESKAEKKLDIAMGYKAESSGAKYGAMALGTLSKAKADKATAIGYNTQASIADSVALGSGAQVNDADKSGVDLGQYGYGYDTWKPSDAEQIWKSTLASVSVGNYSDTRRIAHVAAGIELTDAVNVAQLKAAVANSSINLVAGKGIKIDHSNGTYTISSNSTGETTETGPLNFAADEGTAAEVNPSETLNINGDGKNISTKVNGKNISVTLKDDISVKTVKATDSITVEGGPSMTKDGIDGAGKKITNIAAGTQNGDAVNYGQLKGLETKVNDNTGAITGMSRHISVMDNRINKVGAGAAALAALHPLEFDPTDKWNFAVGYGNYKNANSLAMGAFYRSDENTMFSIGTNFGNGENMVNAGVSFKLGQGNHLASRPVMAKKIVTLEEKIEEQQKTIHSLGNTIEAQNQKMEELEKLIKQQGEIIAKMTKQ